MIVMSNKIIKGKRGKIFYLLLFIFYLLSFILLELIGESSTEGFSYLEGFCSVIIVDGLEGEVG